MDPDLTNIDWERDEVRPQCDTCNTYADELFSGNWCGSCGSCIDHCQGHQGCPDSGEDPFAAKPFVPPATIKEADKLLEELA